MRRSKRANNPKDPTSDFLTDRAEDESQPIRQRFNRRSKYQQANKTARTAAMRQAQIDAQVDVEQLPTGRVIQVHSVYCHVESAGRVYLCVIRKTTARTNDTRVVTGDLVRFSPMVTGEAHEGVIERIEPRRTILTRADVRAEKQAIVGQVPIIANADQMLIVASLLLPRVKWGLVDRMIVAAQAGGLSPVICLNKVDLENRVVRGVSANQARDAVVESSAALAQYQRIGLPVLRCSVVNGQGMDQLAALLRGRVTALAGHSGVGKSSLIGAVEPGLDIRVGEISNYNQKGRHTTTSARLYELGIGGSVVDTPGVKLFGLWNVTADTLPQYFPDVADGTAPDWRIESFQRILASLGG